MIIFVRLYPAVNLYNYLKPPRKLLYSEGIHIGLHATAGNDRGEETDGPFGAVRTRVGKIRGDVWRPYQDISGVARGDCPGSGNVRHGIRLRRYSQPSRTEPAISRNRHRRRVDGVGHGGAAASRAY